MRFLGQAHLFSFGNSLFLWRSDLHFAHEIIFTLYMYYSTSECSEIMQFLEIECFSRIVFVDDEQITIILDLKALSK